jgi:hypothetical protein
MLVADHRLYAAFRQQLPHRETFARVQCHGLFEAISRALLWMPARIISLRRFGRVQEQKTSGFVSSATGSASVPLAAPNLAAAACSRALLTSHKPTTSNRPFA